MWCDFAFPYEKGTLACPKCQTDDTDFLIPIYRENNIQEQAMYCPIDFHGG